MSAFDGRLCLRIVAPNYEDAREALGKIAELASGFPAVEKVTVEPVERIKPTRRRRRRSHA